MNLMLQQETTTRWKRGLLHGMLLLAVMVALPLGMATAAMGAWFAIQGGSLMYLPLGLAILLAGLVVVRSHSIPDFTLLALVACAVIVWLISGIDTRSWMQNSVLDLSGRIDLLFGLLAIMLVALAATYWCRYRAVAVSVR